MTTPKQVVDYAILGGGLAGLALATELAAPEFSHLKIIVIEPRKNYVRDKTWSYWRQAPHAFSDVETAVWQCWQVQSAHKTVNTNAESADNFVYASIASDDFYQAALHKIAASQHIELVQESNVETLLETEHGTDVQLKNGIQILVKQAIFDSRPPQKPEQTHLTQHFMGFQLMAQSPTFDVNSVTLMDFKPSQHGIHFMYVLPYSATEALVESTWICQHQHHTDYAEELDNYVAMRWPDVKFVVKYTETGSLPLITSKPLPCRPHQYWLAGHQNSLVPIINIGTRAGTARAATGYAFLETLSDSARLARLIHEKLPLTAFKRNKIDAWMDAQFLSFLTHHSTMGADYFVQMFANCQPARLIRFLTGQANWQDRLNVIYAVPAWPMMKHLLMGKK